MKAILTYTLLTIIPLGLLLAQHDPPTKLNAPLVSGGEVLEFATSPDGQWVVYKADQDTDNVYELYSVRSAGGAVTKLNAPLISGGAVREFAISPDSAWVVYRADQEVDAHFDLFSVPIAGGSPAKLNGDNPVIRQFAITPDSARVVFIHSYIGWDQRCHCSVPIAGGMLEEFCVMGGSGGYLTGHFEISPDSDFLVFTYTRHGDWYSLLYSFNTDGSGGTAIDDWVQEDRYRISPDSRRVVSNHILPSMGIEGLTSIPIAGGATEYLNDTGAEELKISAVPFGGDYQVVYLHRYRLHSVPVNGGMTAILSPQFWWFTVVPFEISSDGTRVVYSGQQEQYGAAELYSVGTLGGDPVKLNGSLTAGGTVWSFRLSADSRYVVYYADEESDDFYELYSVPVAGGERVNLSGAVRADYQTAGDSASVVYRDYSDELFEVPIRSGDAVRLGGNVQNFSFTGDGRRVVYLAVQPPHDVVELYSVPRAVFGEPSIDRLCPCDGPRDSTTPWKNHGQYVSCVAQAAKGHQDRAEIVSEAAGSDCGK